MATVVLGPDGDAVGEAVRRRREAGERVAGFVGDPTADADCQAAQVMGAEMLGEAVEVVSPEG